MPCIPIKYGHLLAKVSVLLFRNTDWCPLSQACLWNSTSHCLEENIFPIRNTIKFNQVTFMRSCICLLTGMGHKVGGQAMERQQAIGEKDSFQKWSAVQIWNSDVNWLLNGTSIKPYYSGAYYTRPTAKLTSSRNLALYVQFGFTFPAIAFVKVGTNDLFEVFVKMDRNGEIKFM